MSLDEIYDTYTPGSLGFIRAVQTHLSLSLQNGPGGGESHINQQLSDDEIGRIAHASANPEAFMHTWEHETWWLDGCNLED